MALSVLKTIPRSIYAESLVFGNREGGIWTRLVKQWAEAVSASDLKDLHFHDLRRTYATRLVEAGVSMAQVRDLLGHRDYETSERYIHLVVHL